MKFALVTILGFSLIVSSILFAVIISAKGMSLYNIGFVLFVFLFTLIIGFPAVYLFSRFVMKKYFTKWSAQIKVAKVHVTKKEEGN